MLITLYDQTASRRTERQLVEQQWLFGETERLARTGSWQWSGGTFTWSAELYRLHGVSPEKFAPSFESWLALVHSADRNRFRDAIENAIRNGLRSGKIKGAEAGLQRTDEVADIVASLLYR